MAKIHEIAVNDLRPTQITVGMIEVKEKAERIKELLAHPRHLQEFIASHEIPVIAGRNGHFFLIDHHHLGRALWEAGEKTSAFHVIGDLSALDEAAFWKEMDRQHWVHPYDEQGRKQNCDDIPHHIKALRDDPYRSLAAYVRNAGGYEKTPTPFAEFAWADYFRGHFAPPVISKQFHDAVKHALELARDRAAAHLPGYKPAP
jgi:hypothetical protein